MKTTKVEMHDPVELREAVEVLESVDCWIGMEAGTNNQGTGVVRVKFAEMFQGALTKTSDGFELVFTGESGFETNALIAALGRLKTMLEISQLSADGVLLKLKKEYGRMSEGEKRIVDWKSLWELRAPAPADAENCRNVDVEWLHELVTLYKSKIAQEGAKKFTLSRPSTAALAPNEGDNPVVIFLKRIKAFLEQRPGVWLTKRQIYRAINADRYGPEHFNRAMDALIRSEELFKTKAGRKEVFALNLEFKSPFGTEKQTAREDEGRAAR